MACEGRLVTNRSQVCKAAMIFYPPSPAQFQTCAKCGNAVIFELVRTLRMEIDTTESRKRHRSANSFGKLAKDVT